MTVPVLAAAKRLAAQSGWSLSNLEIQKLLYLAHMFHLGRTGGQPLVTGHFEAWDYGPVHPVVYQHVKVFGANPVGNVFHSVPDVHDGLEVELLDDAVRKLSHLSPARLVAITHSPSGAWSRHYKPGYRGIIIPNEDILQEYRNRENAFRAARANG